jgi:hypothetical protein
MKELIAAGKIGTLLLACLTLNAQAKPAAKWIAMSETAMSITGDAYLADNTLSFEHHKLPLTLDKKLDSDELKAAAELLQATMNADTKGELYKTHLPATVHLQNSNTLCGKSDTTWILMVRTVDRNGRSNLDLATFSGAKRPVIQTEALDHSTSLCGTYWYQK